MKLSIQQVLQRIPNWLFWTILIIIALLIVVFNDAFGESEAFGVAAFLYFLLLFFLLIRWIFKQVKSVIRLKNEKAKTELLHLKSQVNPHFFFNMLNNLYGLVAKDSKKAQELILKLSDMMRYSIYEGQKEHVLLSQEIDYLQNYIALHKMRYHKTIKVDFTHEIGENDPKIMPLLFIILLENAFKHGVENLTENAFINLNLQASKNQVSFEIENNYEVTQVNEQEGIGLQNLKRRLQLVYPDKHTLSISKTDDIFKVYLTIKGL